ncbi:Y4yA family PLP-dependent enzyme [Streptomyces sp. 8L]|uniref:Y4yA family PLP-dependent enzyme n=1 Tax=Streptomyces sp. 8L TaxID=2877242 RepID=UPI001CD4F2FF|nr:Y4yA family PLP-dependent enzyme [Streptomyces sp. 8L]MCA1218621.1 Y4yA family PLP-dependent enzyme [Streptomyces sp. 8L]
MSASLTEAAAFLHTLADGLGTPLNVVTPDQIAENAARFEAVLRRHRLGGGVFFAHKASASSALLRRLAATPSSVDVASLEELQHALACGFTPDRITATGPKDPAFRYLGARVGVTFHVDGQSELEALAGLVRDHGLAPVRVLLRLSGFPSAGVRRLVRRSRFGTPVADLPGLLDAVERCGDAVELLGVGYHLDTVSLDEKALALEGCVKAMDACRARGLRPRVVDIGGGFGVSYLAEAGQWEAYTTELIRAVLATRPPLAWGNHGYGLRNESGTLAGGLGLYPAYREVAGPAYLDELLAMRAPSLGRPLATLLLENLYDLRVEPGRALADQCGVTLARVLETRRDTEGGAGLWSVRLDLNAGDCPLEDHGILVDPLIVPRPRPDSGPGAGGRGTEEPRAGGPVAVHLYGNLCLESDLLTKRQVFLPRLPDPGDLLCFVNTAAYCMDFGAHEAERRPRARKVAATRAAGERDGAWRWCLDTQYWPLAVEAVAHHAGTNRQEEASA